MYYTFLSILFFVWLGEQGIIQHVCRETQKKCHFLKRQCNREDNTEMESKEAGAVELNWTTGAGTVQWENLF
jgi:hypothetical protein